MSGAPANWYQDPQDAQQMRYWDGQAWTGHLAPNRAQILPVPPSPQAPSVSASSTVLPAKVVNPEDGPAKVPLFGARAFARQQADELLRLRNEMNRLGILDVAELERQRTQLKANVAAEQETFRVEKDRIERELAALTQRLVITKEEEILQEVGVYAYRHPLSDSIAYKDQMRRMQDQIRAMTRKDGGAIEAATSWTVNGSAVEGRRMVRDFSKLMLRAYNAEADNMVRGLKPYKLATAIDRIEKVALTIERLGATMSIKISPNYHRLRIHELELSADYQEMLAREKERDRAERERLREERKVEQEICREREKLDKERQHYVNALAALGSASDSEAADRLRAQLQKIDREMEDVDYRAANIKAGYVYVISNVGAFGDQVVKIGMTRRLDPLDRVKELSDASVPFNFDVHALFFSKDAVDIENQMHRRLADRRVNRVNQRREFFYATPLEARDHLKDLTGELLQFEEMPPAIEFHQSRQVIKSESGAEASRAR
jgi:hypothetical protein